MVSRAQRAMEIGKGWRFLMGEWGSAHGGKERSGGRMNVDDENGGRERERESTKN